MAAYAKTESGELRRRLLRVWLPNPSSEKEREMLRALLMWERDDACREILAELANARGRADQVAK